MYGSKRFCPHLNRSGVGSQLVVTGSQKLGRATHGVTLGILKAKVISLAFATQGVTMGVTHGLGATAAGWFQIRTNKAGNLYEKANVGTQLRVVLAGTAVTGAAVKIAIW